MNIAIIGGGAAGYFAAINIMEMSPLSNITIYEGASRSLAKVGVSGGGRCNITNSFEEIDELSKAYPRGAKLIKRAFKTFDFKDAKEWFENHGIKLVTQEDQCLFPQSQSSQEVIDTFERLAQLHNITVKHSYRVNSIVPEAGRYRISFSDPKLFDVEVDAVVVTTGGSPKLDGLSMLAPLNLKIVDPLPSLFSFNIPNDPITELMGAVVDKVTLSLQGSKLKSSGALLITHWGVSGPAVLKLSSYAARILAEREYTSGFSVNWTNNHNSEEVLNELRRITKENSGKLVVNIRPFDLPSRLWKMILTKANISHERRYIELGSKGINRLVDLLINDNYTIVGQSRFRDEFVTCGGVAISNIDIATMESKQHPNLYFAGEVLDIDAITGGFNLQAAWSTGYLIAHTISSKNTLKSGQTHEK